MEPSIEHKAAQYLLGSGDKISIPAPFWLRLFGKKKLTFVLRQPTAATCLRVLQLRLSIGVYDEAFDTMTIDQAMRLQVEHGMTVARMIAVVILGSKRNDRLFGRRLAKMLFNQVSFKALMDTMLMVTLDSGLEDFINTIRLTGTMILTKPTDLSQREKGS